VQLIPAIDLKDGRVVRLHQGRFDARTDYSYGAEDLAGQYLAAGAKWVHVVDLDGARDGVSGNASLIETLVTNHPGRLQVAGGIRSEGDVGFWLDAGAGRVVVGSAAMERPRQVASWINGYGPGRVVLALDVAMDGDTPRLRSRGWTEDAGSDLWALLDDYGDNAPVHVLCTDVGRDGAMEGPNVDFYRICTRERTDIRWQASGGVRHLADLEALDEAGASAAIVGRALLEGALDIEEAGPFLPNA
jgi:phosphoribosylformimino-5-aminoimidazole carboxamide ribotide isomerase